MWRLLEHFLPFVLRRVTGTNRNRDINGRQAMLMQLFRDAEQRDFEVALDVITKRL
jgi:hypothetical protein